MIIDDIYMAERDVRVGSFDKLSVCLLLAYPGR